MRTRLKQHHLFFPRERFKQFACVTLGNYGIHFPMQEYDRRLNPINLISIIEPKSHVEAGEEQG